jgi:hypothetical protein
LEEGNVTLASTSRHASTIVRAVRVAFLAAVSTTLACMFACALQGALPVSASAFTEPGYTGSFADFANCPANLPRLGGCLHSYITGGVIQIGHADVPISVPGDTLDLAFYARKEPACEAVDELYGAPEEACVLSPPHGILNGPPQPIPGGLLGSIGDGELTDVQATLEWAQPLAPDTVFGIGGEADFPGAVLSEPRLMEEAGPGLRLSLRIHLIDPFLGPDCFLGSSSEPMTLNLTTGATSPPPPGEPLHGTFPQIYSNPTGEIFLFAGMVLVDNSFSVPAATGCGVLMDAAIDQKLSLPSPAGENTAGIDADADQTSAEALLEHGWSEEPAEPAAQQPPTPEPAPSGPSAEPASAPVSAGSPPQAPAPHLGGPLLATPPPPLATRVHASPTASKRPQCNRHPQAPRSGAQCPGELCSSSEGVRPRHGKPKRCATRAAAGFHSKRSPKCQAKGSR